MTAESPRRSPEKETRSYQEHIALQARLGLGADALNPANTDLEFTHEKVNESIGGAIPAIANASRAERAQYWESKGLTFDQQKETWAQGMANVFAKKKDFFATLEGEHWTSFYQSLGINAQEFSTTDAAAFYDTYFSGGDASAGVEKFIGQIESYYEDKPYEKFKTEGADAVAWIANVFGSKYSGEIIANLADFLQKGEEDAVAVQFIESVRKKDESTSRTRLNSLSSREQELLQFLWDNKGDAVETAAASVSEPNQEGFDRAKTLGELDDLWQGVDQGRPVGGSGIPKPRTVVPEGSYTDEVPGKSLSESRQAREALILKINDRGESGLPTFARLYTGEVVRVRHKKMQGKAGGGAFSPNNEFVNIDDGSGKERDIRVRTVAEFLDENQMSLSFGKSLEDDDHFVPKSVSVDGQASTETVNDSVEDIQIVEDSEEEAQPVVPVDKSIVPKDLMQLVNQRGREGLLTSVKMKKSGEVREVLFNHQKEGFSPIGKHVNTKTPEGLRDVKFEAVAEFLDENGETLWRAPEDKQSDEGSGEAADLNNMDANQVKDSEGEAQPAVKATLSNESYGADSDDPSESKDAFKELVRGINSRSSLDVPTFVRLKSGEVKAVSFGNRNGAFTPNGEFVNTEGENGSIRSLRMGAIAEFLDENQQPLSFDASSPDVAEAPVSDLASESLPLDSNQIDYAQQVREMVEIDPAKFTLEDLDRLQDAWQKAYGPNRNKSAANRANDYGRLDQFLATIESAQPTAGYIKEYRKGVKDKLEAATRELGAEEGSGNQQGELDLYLNFESNFPRVMFSNSGLSKLSEMDVQREYSGKVEIRHLDVYGSSDHAYIVDLPDGKEEDSIGMRRRGDGTLDIALADGVSGAIFSKAGSRAVVGASLGQLENGAVSMDTIIAAHHALQNPLQEKVAKQYIDQLIKNDVTKSSWYSYGDRKLSELNTNPSLASSTMLVAAQYTPSGELKYAMQGDMSILHFKADGTFDHIQGDMYDQLVYKSDFDSSKTKIGSFIVGEGEIAILQSDGAERIPNFFNQVNTFIQENRGSKELDQRVATYIADLVAKSTPEDDVTTVVLGARIPGEGLATPSPTSVEAPTLNPTDAVESTASTPELKPLNSEKSDFKNEFNKIKKDYAKVIQQDPELAVYIYELGQELEGPMTDTQLGKKISEFTNVVSQMLDGMEKRGESNTKEYFALDRRRGAIFQISANLGLRSPFNTDQDDLGAESLTNNSPWDISGNSGGENAGIKEAAPSLSESKLGSTATEPITQTVQATNVPATTTQMESTAPAPEPAASSQSQVKLEKVTDENFEKYSKEGREILVNGSAWKVLEVLPDGRAILQRNSTAREILDLINQVQGAPGMLPSYIEKNVSVRSDQLQRAPGWIVKAPRSPQDPTYRQEIEDLKELAAKGNSPEFNSNQHGERDYILKGFDFHEARLKKEQEEYARSMGIPGSPSASEPVRSGSVSPVVASNRMESAVAAPEVVKPIILTTERPMLDQVRDVLKRGSGEISIQTSPEQLVAYAKSLQGLPQGAKVDSLTAAFVGDSLQLTGKIKARMGSSVEFNVAFGETPTGMKLIGQPAISYGGLAGMFKDRIDPYIENLDKEIIDALSGALQDTGAKAQSVHLDGKNIIVNFSK